jgi:Pyruvate/2-oxoacid:ferredoxin oxidoreductase delta subunit
MFLKFSCGAVSEKLNLISNAFENIREGMMEVYSSLSRKVMGQDSKKLDKIWSILASPEEAAILDMLPKSAEEVAQAAGISPDKAETMLDNLFHKGVAFDGIKNGRTIFRMPRHIIQFHDASLLWAEAPEELFTLWAEYMETEYRAMVEQMTELKMPSFMRVLAINETVENKSSVLGFEDAADILKNARAIAVTSCVCRKSVKKCENPIEVCLQVNRGAEYNIKRGTGRAIDLAEALDILKLSEDKGLVHMTENIAGGSNVICNCCTCCCEMLRYAVVPKTKNVVAPSRFTASVNSPECTFCGLCEDVCPMKAISADSDKPATVNSELCIGCGLCAAACTPVAIRLVEVRTEDFIPKKA